MEGITFDKLVWKNPHARSHDVGFKDRRNKLPYGPASGFNVQSVPNPILISVGKMQLNPEISLRNYTDTIFEALHEYTNRVISFNEDAVLAVAGVLRAFGNQTFKSLGYM